MRVGALVLPTDPLEAAQAQAVALEEAGFDHLWTYDHMTWRRYRDRPWFSASVWLAAVASSTERIELGTMVANPNLHQPLTLTKDFVGLDHLSGGRMLLGIGAGGIGYDATVMGHDVLSPGRRIDRLIEYVDVVGALMEGREIDHGGAFYRLERALVLPTPHRRPRIPILVAAGGRRGLTLAGERADGWITWGDTLGDDRSEAATDRAVVRQIEVVREAAERTGRTWDDLRRVFLIGNTEARPLADIDAFTAFASRYAALGFTDLVFHHPRKDDPVWNDDPGVVHEIARRLGEIHEL